MVPVKFLIIQPPRSPSILYNQPMVSKYFVGQIKLVKTSATGPLINLPTTEIISSLKLSTLFKVIKGIVQNTFCRPAYPKPLVSVLQTACVHIFRFLMCLDFQIFDLIFADTPPINQNKTGQSTIFLSFILQEKCVNSHFQLYRHTTKLVCYNTWTTLFCLHLLQSFSFEDHKILSLKAMHHVCCFR